MTSRGTRNAGPSIPSPERDDAPALVWRRRRGGVALIVGLGALLGALAIARFPRQPTLRPITLTTGLSGTTLDVVAQTLLDELAQHGLPGRLVETRGSEDELERVDRGEIDFALVSGAYRVATHARVREVTPLYVEALHLLVRDDLAPAVDEGLGALRGHSVDLGPNGTSGAALAEEVLQFAGLTGGGPAPAYEARHLDFAAVEALAQRAEPGALPDAVFHLGTVPSKVVLALVHTARYRLVALPFAAAFRLNTLIRDHTTRTHTRIDRHYTTDTVIPAFTYGTEPAVPSEPLATVGARLWLVANDAVPAAIIEHVLEAVFTSRFARITEPPLDRSLLHLPVRLQRHPGSITFGARDKPLITDETVDELSNTLSIVGALGGAALFLWQWRRQRASARHDETFGSCMLRVATIERRAAELELSATLELEPLVALQRELLQLKSETLERFAAGELGGQGTLSDLLMPLNAARDHIGELILHVRSTLEDRAASQGRPAQALWTDAIRESDESGKT